MVISSETSAAHMLYVTDDVISKTRNEVVYNGELEETVLHQIEATWKRKMIQAGVISGTIERSSDSIPTPTHLQTQDQKPLPGIADNAQFLDPVVPVKRERDGSFIPQQDGTNDEDEDDELLSLDDDEEVAAMDDDETDIPHLVMCQFDNVKRNKNKWECKLKSGIMQINGKNILFSGAKGDFNF